MLRYNMNFKMFSFLLKILTIAVIITIFMPGCGQSSQKPAPQPQPQQMQSEQQGGKVPDQLKEIEGSIESIIKAMNGPAIGAKDEGDKGGKPAGQGGGQQGGQQGGPQSGQQGGQQQGQAVQQPKQPDTWDKVAPIVNKMHYAWNNYMPQAVKEGANRSLIDNFENALNGLTNSVISKNHDHTLMAANNLYQYIPDFYSLYRMQTSPEIKRIRYYTRDAVLNAMISNWSQAESDINSLKSSWSLYKNAVSKDHQDSANKLDFSIYQLERVVKEKNQPLTDIKGRVALSNIESMEKSMEDQSKHKGQGASQSGGGAGGGTSGGGASGGSGQGS